MNLYIIDAPPFLLGKKGCYTIDVDWWTRFLLFVGVSFTFEIIKLIAFLLFFRFPPFVFDDVRFYGSNFQPKKGKPRLWTKIPLEVCDQI